MNYEILCKFFKFYTKRKARELNPHHFYMGLFSRQVRQTSIRLPSINIIQKLLLNY